MASPVTCFYVLVSRIDGDLRVFGCFCLCDDVNVNPEIKGILKVLVAGIQLK